MNPILHGAQVKIDRAREKFNALKESVAPFRNGEAYELIRHPYELMAAPNGRTDHAGLWFSLRSVKEIPVFLGVGVGEILHDLRSALDHIVYELSRINCETQCIGFEPDATQFPIFLSDKGDKGASIKALRSGFSDKFNGREGPRSLHQAAPEVRTHIQGLQPFTTGEGPDSPLWQLQELSNWDKHRTIYTTSAFKHGSAAEFIVIQEFRGLMLTPNGPFEGQARVGGVCLAPRIGVAFDEWIHEVQVKFDITTYIAFKQPTPCAPLAVEEVVGRIGHRVGQILEGIDKAFF